MSDLYIISDLVFLLHFLVICDVQWAVWICLQTNQQRAVSIISCWC